MSYLVLARKYRPQSFADLVGQSHVSDTLANGILQGRVAHAFLFTGARGVGKTTSARLLAKCLNCLGADGQATGPTSTPCGTCAACTEITLGTDMDVQEIDGASYNGIDEVRRLQETCGYRPARDRYKVYIVDEVHMLSNAAWNAFLKTLEEPPSHVKFIFATTEIQKVPITILSRCQRYDFRLVSVLQITERLQTIIAAEGLEADPAALRMVARQAAGSMRDALSLLDQVLAFAIGPLAAKDVATVLGVADRGSCARAAQAVIVADAKAVLAELNVTLQGGADLAQYARDLLEYFRDAVTAKVSENSELFELPAQELEALHGFVSEHTAGDLARVFQGFSSDFERIVRSHAPRHTLEMSLVKLASRAPLVPVDELLARLRDLERRLAGKASPPGPPEPASPTALFPVLAGDPLPKEAPQTVVSRPSPFAAPAEHTEHTGAAAGERNVEPKAPMRRLERIAERATSQANSPFAAPPMLDENTIAKPTQAAALRDPRTLQKGASETPQGAHFEMPPEARWGDEAMRGASGTDSVGSLASLANVAPQGPKAPEFVEFGKELCEADELRVRALVDVVRRDAPVLASAVENAWIAEVDVACVVLAFPQGSFLGSGIDELGKSQLAAAATELWGDTARVNVVSHLTPKETATSLAERDARGRHAVELASRKAAEEHPLVLRAAELLRARVRHVRLSPKE